MKRKLLLAALCVVGALGFKANAQWTDYTSAITNPSFETDAANSDLTTCGWATNRATGWTILPASPSNAQIGIGNSESKVQGVAAHSASAGDQYLYIRYNWNANAEFSVAQTTTAALPAGLYCLSVKLANFASVNSTWTLSVQEGDGTAVTSSITGKGAADSPWNLVTVFINKTSAESNLTIKASMKFSGSDDAGRHFCMLLDDFQLKKADSPATPLTNGTSYYFYNEETGQYASAGGSWGTHAFADGTGLAMTAALNNGVYTLTPEEFSNNKFTGLYMDGTATTPWVFLETSAGSGKYYMTQDGTNYLASNGANAELVNVTNPSNAAVWTVVSKTDRKTALSAATIAAPMNATFLLADPNFGRNNSAYSSWIWTFPNGENKNNSGDNTNFVVECFQKQFTFKQTLAAGTAPAGVYSLTAQGFYRQDGSDNEHLPVFFINNETGTFPIRGAAAENSMSAASTSFKAGNYTIDPIYVRVENTDALEVGAKLETNEKLWCIWDNFQLKYYGDVTVAEVKLAAYVEAYNAALAEAQAFTEASMFADGWTALQTAITDNTLDLNDSELTESDLTTATTNLTAANTAATAAVAAKTNYTNATTAIGEGTEEVDLTSLIGNPSFESTAAYAAVAGGWVNEGVGLQGQTNDGFDGYRVGNVFAERWVASGSIGAFKTYQNIAALPAGLYKVSVVATFNGNGASLFANDATATITDATTYSVLVQISDKGAIELGLQTVSPSGTWFKADNFTLTYLPDFPVYTLATGKMGTDKAAAQTAAENTYLADKTVANYNALLAAIAEAEASVANYTALKAAIDKAEAVKEANNFVTDDAANAFQTVIDEATTGWTNVSYTDAQATDKIAALGTAVSGHRGNATGAAGTFMVSTWDTNTDGETAGSWDGYYINTWSTEGDNDGSGFSVPFFEWFVGNTNNIPLNQTKTATLSGLENGMYEVELWARVQRRTDANFGDNDQITMSVNNGTAVSIMNSGTTIGSGDTQMRIGRYTARGEVTDGTLTLSIKTGGKGSNVHWLCWRDVKYTKLDEATMTVKAGKYGTFIAPFEVTIPTGIVAYEVASVTDKDVKLVEINNSPLAAQTPVILKNTTEADKTETFYGTSLTDSETEVGEYLVGVYKANVDIPENSYVLQTDGGVQAFYKVGSGFKSSANRCYLTSNVTTGANVRSISFAGEATGIEAIGVLTSGNYDAIYTAGGAKVNSLQKGLNIVVKDGKSYKIFVK